MSSADRQHAPASRSSRIDTRLDPQERALVENAAREAGLPVSAFVRGASVGEARKRLGYLPARDAGAVAALLPQPSPEDRAARDALRVETRRVGVLLNQLVRLAHQGRLDLGELRPVVEELAAVQQEHAEQLGGRA